MTYVSDMNSDQLASHMSMLQATPGWHAPLDDRLWAEVQALKNEVQRITEARRVEWANAQQVEAHNEALTACIEGLSISLESEVVAKYAGMEAHPALKRKYDSDMSEVLEARALIEKAVRP